MFLVLFKVVLVMGKGHIRDASIPLYFDRHW